MPDPASPANVLIIDDDPLCAESLVSILELEGYEVACAADGREGLAYLHEGHLPCLILLDLMMPVMDGWQFREQQRQDPALAEIPVVVMSGAQDPEPAALSVDAAGYFLKPYRVKELLDLVARHCRQGSAE